MQIPHRAASGVAGRDQTGKTPSTLRFSDLGAKNRPRSHPLLHHYVLPYHHLLALLTALLSHVRQAPRSSPNQELCRASTYRVTNLMRSLLTPRFSACGLRGSDRAEEGGGGKWRRKRARSARWQQEQGPCRAGAEKRGVEACSEVRRGMREEEGEEGREARGCEGRTGWSLEG